MHCIINIMSVYLLKEPGSDNSHLGGSPGNNGHLEKEVECRTPTHTLYIRNGKSMKTGT